MVGLLILMGDLGNLRLLGMRYGKSLGALGLIILGAAGCSPPAQPPGSSESKPARLGVTDQFTTILHDWVEVEADGRSVLELTRAAYPVGTEHRGGFLVRLAGVPAPGQDSEDGFWLYYVNGVAAHLGAGDYIPARGDVIWWNWNRGDARGMPRALIGAFPRPLVGGYHGRCPPVALVHDEAQAESAERLEDTLRAAGAVVVRRQVGLAGKSPDTRRFQWVMLGELAMFEQDAWLRTLLARREKTGLFFEWEDGMLYGLDRQGQRSIGVKEGAVLAAAYVGAGQDFPVWIVTGTDRAWTERACAVLIEATAVRGRASLLLHPDGLSSLPYVP